jgi:hypothetical protein
MKFIDEKERTYSDLRKRDMMEQHPELEPYMRAILLDWMIEVNRRIFFEKVIECVRILRNVEYSDLWIRDGKRCLTSHSVSVPNPIFFYSVVLVGDVRSLQIAVL